MGTTGTVPNAMNARDVVLIRTLVDHSPSLLSVLQTHVDDYSGLLPHLFMADVARWSVARYEANPGDPELLGVLQFMEESFAAGRAEDHELIAASFLENLPRRSEVGSGLPMMLGPGLRRHVDRFQ